MAEPIDPGVDVGHVHLKVSEPQEGQGVEMYVRPLDLESLTAELE